MAIDYALKHQTFDSIRFVAVDGSGNVYTGDTWGCPAYASQCVSTTPVQDPAQDGTIVSVVKEGYAIGDEILRPAAVVVGRHG